MTREPMMLNRTTYAAALLPLGLMLTLGACGSAEEEPVDPNISTAGPGELIVPEDEPAVPVDLPEAPLTPLPGNEGVDVDTTTVVEE